MANQTAIGATSVHGTDPQNLIPLIARNKIYNSLYWKEKCFGLTAETIVDKVAELKYVGGLYGGLAKPTKFLCLTLKLLQLQPDRDVILWFLNQSDFKYMRALAAFYIRLTDSSVGVYTNLEPYYADYRKLCIRTLAGWDVVPMDMFVQGLLTKELFCDTVLPYLPKRPQLEQQRGLGSGHGLPRRVSLLSQELLLMEKQRLQEQQQHRADGGGSGSGTESDGRGDAPPSGAARDQSHSSSRKRSRSTSNAADDTTQAQSADVNSGSLCAVDPSETPDFSLVADIIAPEGSVEYWNEVRARLGMKPLR